MRPGKLGVVGLLAATLALPALAGEPLDFTDLGPLRIRDQFLLGMGFLAFDPEAADMLPEGRWQIDLVATVTNTFAKSNAITELLDGRDRREAVTADQLRSVAAGAEGGIFYLDGETYRTAVAIRRGVGRRLQLGVILQGLKLAGGGLDSTIEGFHSAFGLGQAGRLGTLRNEYSVFVSANGSELLIHREPAFDLGDVVLSAKYGLIDRPGTTYLSVEGLVKLPTGSEVTLYSSGSVDVGVQVLYSRFWPRSCVHASAGVLRLGAFDRLGIDAQTLLSGMLAYEHGVFTDRWSVLAQATISQSPFRQLELAELSEISIQTSLGVKCAFGRDWVLFVALTENLVHFDNTADVGFHLGWTQRI